MVVRVLQYKIDYVAHDVDPYGSAGFDDVYAFCKISGMFLSPRSSMTPTANVNLDTRKIPPDTSYTGYIHFRPARASRERVPSQVSLPLPTQLEFPVNGALPG